MISKIETAGRYAGSRNGGVWADLGGFNAGTWSNGGIDLLIEYIDMTKIAWEDSHHQLLLLKHA
jgi:hypothetical protein